MLVHLGVTAMSPSTRTVPMKVKTLKIVVGGHVPILFSTPTLHLVEFRFSCTVPLHLAPFAFSLYTFTPGSRQL